MKMNDQLDELDQIIRNGTQFVDGRFEIAIAIQSMWERWDRQVDHNSIGELNASIQYLQEVQAAALRVVEGRANPMSIPTIRSW